MKDGTKTYVEASHSPIRETKEGPPIGFRGIVRAVTERKETEKKIKQLLGSFGKNADIEKKAFPYELPS